jgi:hypothetical protein
MDMLYSMVGVYCAPDSILGRAFIIPSTHMGHPPGITTIPSRLHSATASADTLPSPPGVSHSSSTTVHKLRSIPNGAVGKPLKTGRGGAY